MKKILTLSILCFLFKNIFSQNKKTIYLNQYDVEVSEKQFNSFNKKEVYIKESENDTLLIKKIIFKKNIGTLKPKQHKQVNQILFKIIGSSFDLKKNTIIHFYNKNNKALKKDLKNKRYWGWIKTNSQKIQSFLIVSKESEITKDKHIYIDSLDLLRKVFFSNNDFNINHLYIEPNGDISIFYGDDDILKILDSCV